MLLGLAASVVLAALSIAPVLADEPTESELRRANQEVRTYVSQMAGHGHAAVEAAQLALQRSQDPAVRQLAQQVLDERIPTTLALADKAANSNVHAPQALLAEDQAALTRLGTLSGGAFDRAYVEYMVLQLRSDERIIQRANGAWRGGWSTNAKNMEPLITAERRQAENLAAALGVTV
jgi:predicted outer membrane protein